MYQEGRRRAEAGEHVVIGWVERHGRAETRAVRGDLEVVHPKVVQYRGRPFEEVDVDAIIAIDPDVVLVDELAHSYPDGSRRRWQDVADLLDAGLPVITTVNIANLESVRDYAAQITGTGAVEAVPDDFVRSGEVVLIDLPPEVLRRRIAAGNVYSAEYVGGALTSYFRTTNVAALGELGRAWMDGTVDDVGPALVARNSEDIPPRPSVVAGVSDSEWGEGVIREASALAARDDADLVVVHVDVADGLRKRQGETLQKYRKMTAEAGGSWIEIGGTDPAGSLAEAARAHNATRVVVARHRSLLNELFRGSMARRLGRLLPDIEVTAVHPVTDAA
jgi:two-component system sensor histidine kinase KdpD